MPTNITHVFVLMLENRSFDHMLGFSGITGIDAVSGSATGIAGLSGDESNSYGPQTYGTGDGFQEPIPVDPGHEFLDVLEQLCGTRATYSFAGAYPPIDCSGFVSNYVHSHEPSEGDALSDFREIMQGFSPAQVPVIIRLAREFALCDRWHASVPGPTWPNRLFAMGGSSGGLDHSPTNFEIATWETIRGFALPKGSIFDALGKRRWRIYAGSDFPLVAALKGISLWDIRDLKDFAGEIAKQTYPPCLTWIEPNYGDVAWGTFRGGNSQHPRDGVAGGEQLINSVYEAIRRSAHWNTSLLIVTWDEHGGFFDHEIPREAPAPEDTRPGSKYNHHGFTFEQYGVRVPAVVVSAWIPPGTIDHRQYDHASIPATIEEVWSLRPLTRRDAGARSVCSLLSLTEARTDVPDSLLPAQGQVQVSPEVEISKQDGPVDHGSLPVFLHVAMRHDLALSPQSAESTHRILRRVQSIQTRAQAQQYFDEVGSKVRAAKAGGRLPQP